MFEFFLSVRVFFWLVGAGRMPRRCGTATITNKGSNSNDNSVTVVKKVHLEQVEAKFLKTPA